jgi:tRNA nucleotidyltransferase (CCA-adding enzyme)
MSWVELHDLMLCLSPPLLGTASTKGILRVTVRVTTTAFHTYPTWCFMKRKEAHAEPSIISQSRKRTNRKMAAKSKKNAIFLQTLETRERRLQALLVDVAQFIDESKQIQERIELRWAGGWVRDRLLGIPSQDIDTTINCMTGLAFCEQMKKYVDIPKNLEKHSIQKQDLGTLHTIQANPEKSKHLETTTVKIFGFDVDFVNLRQETYTSDSRNPQMEFGSAKQDAERRDATINALFYNLHSKEVEDFCGGLTDLDAKIIRTPLDPLTTFTDDPLRVLRLIRFASRLQFKIDPATEASMSDPAVNDALKVKISRERVGVELEKMLKGEALVTLAVLDLL